MAKFYLDGVASDTKYIQLQKPVRFSEAVPVVETVHVPGRNGDLKFYSGEYENRKAKADCFILAANAESYYHDVNAFLFGTTGYRKLTTDEDTTHFWKAAISNASEIQTRMKVLAPFGIEWDCKPQRFLNSGETVTTRTVAGNIVNPTAFESLPLIKITGSGTVNLNIASQVVKVVIDNGDITLDSETQNAYKGTTNLNAKVTGAFPKLYAGTNAISWSGGTVTKVEITPRWWEL